MAEPNPVSDVNSILSQDNRNSMLGRSQILSIVKTEVESSKENQRIVDDENVKLITEQQTALSGFNSGILLVRDDIEKLNASLNGISLAIQQESITDQNRIRSQQERERILAEQQVRIGKEGDIENKIQTAVITPVEKLVPEIKDTFGGVTEAIKFLFGGWITTQIIGLIASNTNATERIFGGIKDSVIKTVEILTGGLSAMGSGFSGIMNILTNITGGIKNILTGKPLEFLTDLIPRLSRLLGFPSAPDTSSGTPPEAPVPAPEAPATDSSTTPPSSPPTPAQIQSAGAPSPSPPLPPQGQSTETGTQSAPMPSSGTPSGSNLTVVAMPPVAGVTTTTSTATTSQSPSEAQTTAINTQTAAQISPPPTVATAAPQETMMGRSVSSPQTSTLSPERIAQFEQAWKYRNFPGAKSEIRKRWDQLSIEEQRQAKQWADSKGYDWSELGLPIPNPAQTTQTSTTGTIGIPEARVTPPPREAQQVGETPQAAPTVTIVPMPQPTRQASTPSSNAGQLTDVPMINSSNPDNFYVLYSQLSYNVVM